MNTGYIRNISFNDIVDLATGAEEELIISMPNMHDELCETVISCKDRIGTVRVIIDNSEDNYRNGFGDIDGIIKMKAKGVDVYNVTGNFVSFIISDKKGYYFFPRSRIFTDSGDKGLNAVMINPVDVALLKKFFFHTVDNKDEYEFKEEIIGSIEISKHVLRDIIDDNGLHNIIQVNELKLQEISSVNSKLRADPPLNPDLKRKIYTYSAKVQFAEFSFDGANIAAADIKIPPKALPFRNSEIKRKLKTKMRLFGNAGTIEKFSEFNEFKKEVEKLRSDFLVPLKSRKDKSIIKTENKLIFEEKYKNLEDRLPEINKNLQSFVQHEIFCAEDQIQKELTVFLTDNVPDKFKNFTGVMLDKSIEREASRIISAIKFPDADNILGRLKLNLHFYDLTIQDFRDINLLDEFKQKGIMPENDIKDIVDFDRAIAVRKEI